MAKKKVKTIEEKIDDLAAMTARGFSDIEKQMTTIATKDDLKEVTARLDRIEFHMNTHERRIEMLEDKMRIVSTKIGLKKG